MSTQEQLKQSDQWLDRTGPEEHVVVSSRARYARNLPRIPFPMRAKAEELKSVGEKVAHVVKESPRFRAGFTFNLQRIKSLERTYLKENHLISVEMEKGAEYRYLYLSRDVRFAMMVNEEDHLRIYAVDGGFQPYETLNSVLALDDELNRELHFAFSAKYGYLTACPTNTGTGLRASVMLHLPALAITKKLPEIIKAMPPHGLTVRGFYGENSENMGDFFQISNEVTLGKSERQIVETLVAQVEMIIQREEQARHTLFERQATTIEDELWRAYGLLTNARTMTSQEGVALLSKLRFGIDHGYFDLSHSGLNKLIIMVQPGHLQYTEMAGSANSEMRDAVRADFLRKRLQSITKN
jgi:protein arginine kinase